MHLSVEDQDRLSPILDNPAWENYLRKMFIGNIAFLPKHLWVEAIQTEIVDRNLVNPNGIEHRFLIAIAKGEI